MQTTEALSIPLDDQKRVLDCPLKASQLLKQPTVLQRSHKVCNRLSLNPNGGPNDIIPFLKRCFFHDPSQRTQPCSNA